MKKFLIVAAASLLIFGGQPAEAADVGNLNVQGVEVQEMRHHPGPPPGHRPPPPRHRW